MKFNQKLKTFIANNIEDAIDLIISEAHESAGTTSGDITPEQVYQLGEIKEQLQALVYEQVIQNMTPEQLAVKDSGSLVDQKFSEYLLSLDDQAIAGLLREMAFSLGEQERRAFIIKHLPELRSAAVHENHCDESGCKYGDQDCPVSEEVLWNVPVMRTGYGHTLIAVTARTEQEAIEKALDEAGGEDFSENSSEYEAPDGAHRVG